MNTSRAGGLLLGLCLVGLSGVAVAQEPDPICIYGKYYCDMQSPGVEISLNGSPYEVYDDYLHYMSTACDGSYPFSWDEPEECPVEVTHPYAEIRTVRASFPSDFWCLEAWVWCRGKCVKKRGYGNCCQGALESLKRAASKECGHCGYRMSCPRRCRPTTCCPTNCCQQSACGSSCSSSVGCSTQTTTCKTSPRRRRIGLFRRCR